MTANIAKEKKDSWIRGLDSIRFLLAFIVFFAHLESPVIPVLMSSTHLILRLAGMSWGVLFKGVGAVMAFFIISGFVIHYPNKDRYPPTGPFLVRRWLRIGLPLLVIGLIASLFHQYSVIPVWSLYCELIYYTLYPLLIRMHLSWKNKFWISFLLSTIVIIFTAPNDWASLIHQKNINYSGAYWQLGDLFTWILGLPCWILGVILAQNIDSYQEKISKLQLYSFRLLVFVIFVIVNILKFHFFFGYFFSMNLFALLLFFWIKREILFFKHHAPSPILEYAGKFSYSLYLCHNVFVFFIVMWIPINVYTYLPIILLTIFFSWLFYLVVERPSHLLSIRIAKKIPLPRIAKVYK